MTDHESIGLVLKNYSGFYYVQTSDGHLYECKTRGKLKQQVVSGDWVTFTRLDDGRGILESIQPRKSLLYRPKIANVTMVLIVMAVAKPSPSITLLDRLLLLASLQQLTPCIILNKCDLEPDPKAVMIEEYYPQAGFSVVSISAKQQHNMEEIRQLLRGQIAVLAGPSGVGKTSLINALSDNQLLKTQEVSSKIGRGRHTTRHVELFTIGNNGWIADTPGFSVLDLPAIKSTQLANHYPDFAFFSQECRFGDCLHFRETDCGVKTAVDKGVIPQFRYNNYIQLLEEVMEKEKCYR